MASCWVEDAWLPTVHNMLEDIPYQCPIIKDLVMAVSVGLVLRGLPWLNLTLCLLRDVCCAEKGSLTWSVRQRWGDLSVYNASLPAVLERMRGLVCSEGCTKQYHFCL